MLKIFIVFIITVHSTNTALVLWTVVMGGVCRPIGLGWTLCRVKAEHAGSNGYDVIAAEAGGG